MPSERWQFTKVGLGYMVSEPSIQTTIRVTNLKRSGGDLTGNLQIIANIEGLKTGAGNLVHQAR